MSQISQVSELSETPFTNSTNTGMDIPRMAERAADSRRPDPTSSQSPDGHYIEAGRFKGACLMVRHSQAYMLSFLIRPGAPLRANEILLQSYPDALSFGVDGRPERFDGLQPAALSHAICAGFGQWVDLEDVHIIKKMPLSILSALVVWHNSQIKQR